MLKIAGLALIFVSPLLYGIKKAQKYKKELAFTCSAFEFAKHISSSVKYLNMSTDEMIGSFVSKSEEFSVLLLKMTEVKSGQAFSDGIAADMPVMPELTSFLCKIGKVSKQELCSIADYYSGIFGTEYENRKNAIAQKYKSSIVAGMAVGALLVILFI